MRDKFEILAKASGWNESLSREGNLNSRNEFSADPESLSRLVDHVLIVLERREITCIELNRSLERQQLELEASREQVSLASTRLKEMRDRLTVSESNGIELNGKISSLTAQLMSQEQVLKREKAQAAWSSEELQRTLDSFATFRREQSIQTAESRAQADSAQTQFQESQQRLERTLQSLKEREQQLSSLQEQVSNLKAQISANEANFTREMNSTSRMVDLYRNASEDATSRIAILQAEVEELRDLLSAAEAQESGHTADLEAELEDRESLIKIKEEQLEKMRIALDGLLKVAKTACIDSEPLGGSTDFLKDLESTEIDQTNLSVKQIYFEYATCRGKLAKTEEECSQLRRSVQEMIHEVNSRAPLFESLQNDNSRLQLDVSALTEQLIHAATARDSAIGERAEFERTLSALKYENEALQQDCTDLSQQVQRLLVEIENNGQSNGKETGKRHRSADNNNILRASEIISENLVDLTSVAHLQQRNQELLRSLRSITAKYEALEREKEAPHLKSQLEAALRELDDVHEARRRQAQMVETILKTKAFDNNTQAGPNSSSKPAFSETMSLELEQLRNQLDNKQECLKKTISELEDAKKDLAEERVNRAKLSAQLEMNEERLKMIKENLEQERSETAAARARVSSQMDSFNLAQASSHKLMADLSNAQDRENHLHGQVERLQGEISNLLINASRLQQETISVSGERDRLTSLMTSMQGVLSEHEASEATLKRHFTAQIEFMERELESSRARISEINNSHSTTVSTLERDRAELFKRLEGLSEELSQRKEVNLRLESCLTQAQEKITDLERVLQQAAAESNHDENASKTYELRIRALSAELKIQQASMQMANSRISELEEQMKEIDSLKAELSSEKENVQSKETSLNEAKAELEHVKGDRERLEDEINSTKDELLESKNRIKQLTEELEGLQAQLTSSTEARTVLEEEKRALSIQLSEAKEQCNAFKSTLLQGENERKHLKLKIEDLEGRVKGLQEQNEVLLDESQKPAAEDDLGVIRFLRDEKDKLQVERDGLVGQIRNLQAQLDESQRTLNSERESVAAQAADYARLLKEVEGLNTLREGGALVQHETNQMKMKLTILESQLKEKNAALGPLRESLQAAQVELEQLRESLACMQSDRDTWKVRFEGAISAASETSPLESELKQVKMQSEMFRQRAIALTKNLSEARAFATKEIDDLRAEIKQLEGKIAALTPQPEDVEMMDYIVEDEAIDTTDDASNVVPVNSVIVDEPEVVASSEELEKAVQTETEDEDDVDDETVLPDESSKISEEDSTPSEPSTHSTSIYEPSSIASTITEASVGDLLSMDQKQPEQPQVPRKKIVSLAGIVSSNTSTTPAMITTASGKKFTPITFPDPPTSSTTANTTTTTAAAAANANNSTGASPVKRNKKTIKKGKNSVNKKE